MCLGCSRGIDAPADDAASVGLYLEGVPVNRFSIVGMLPENTLHIAARVRTAAGTIIGTEHATVTSRNSAAITIDSTGLMRVVGRGSSWVVAGYISPRGLLSDSVTVAVVCTTEARAAITATISDSATGSPAGLTSLWVVARQGTYRDSTFFPAVPAGQTALMWGLAFERPGTYDVRAGAAGYASWQQLGVTVSADLCHVVGVPLTVRLQRQ